MRSHWIRMGPKFNKTILMVWLEKPILWERCTPLKKDGHHLSDDLDHLTAAATAKSLQLCLTLCDPIGGSPPGSLAPGILQARTLEWVAISFSNAWKWKVKVKPLSHVQPSATRWTAALQAPPSVGFSRDHLTRIYYFLLNVKLSAFLFIYI